jgi:hypothetical protein
MPSVTGTMATDRPERYAKQLVSHWSKRGPVTEEEGATVQRWETGQVLRLTPRDGELEIQITVVEGDDAARFAQVVKEHLERFGGQRDELEVVWHL